jgi:hypothetical protein
VTHPLLPWFLGAAAGRFPAVDGGVTMMPPLDRGLEAVVSFTGHACIASRWSADDLADLAPDGYGAALHPRLLLRLAGDGDVGVIDATLVATGTGLGGPPATDRWDDHFRVAHARALRNHVRVHGDDHGFVTIASGLAGRTELSIQTVDDTHDTGYGRSLIASALGLVPAGEPVFAAVSPGNARSLRAFLSQGFRVVGSEVVIRPA